MHSYAGMASHACTETYTSGAVHARDVMHMQTHAWGMCRCPLTPTSRHSLSLESVSMCLGGVGVTHTLPQPFTAALAGACWGTGCMCMQQLLPARPHKLVSELPQGHQVQARWGWVEPGLTLQPPPQSPLGVPQIPCATHVPPALRLQEPYYVRCIKPNDHKSPMAFDEERCRHQVAYLGLLENVRVRRAGFASRQPYGRFLLRYDPPMP